MLQKITVKMATAEAKVSCFSSFFSFFFKKSCPLPSCRLTIVAVCVCQTLGRGTEAGRKKHILMDSGKH